MNKLDILIVIGLTVLLITIPIIFILVFIGFAFGLTNLLVIATYMFAIEGVVTLVAFVVTLIVKLWEAYYYSK